jgi:hypothetical protein
MPAVDHDLRQRLRIFLDAGLLRRIPTRWQIQQGTLQMLPYVSSTDATAEAWYEGAPFGHPLVRQPLIIARVGLDHFRTGPALGAKRSSLVEHLHLTYHQGMPVFDLQLVQTHERGLDVLRERTEVLLANDTPRARRFNRYASLILPRAHDYYRQFLGSDGWIARAERLEYPTPEQEGAAFPPEFYSLVGFLSYCADAFPARPGDVAWTRLPAHLLAVAGRRFREGRAFGWFAPRR